MKNNYLPYIIIGSLLLIMAAVIFFTNQDSQNSIKTNEFKVNETIPTTTETIDNYAPEPVNNTKFVLTVFETQEPTLFYQDPIRSIVPGMDDMDEFYTVSWRPNLTVYKVLEFERFTNDDGYKLMDELEKFATIVPEHFRQEVNSKISPHTERDKLLLNKTKITKRYYLTFTSYTEASIKRQELLKTQSN